MKKLLVTGGAGFIGSEFVRQGVKRGYTIVLVDKLTYAGDRERIKEAEKEIVFHRADVADKESVHYVFRTEKPDAVAHFAAESHVDRSILDAAPFLDTNVKETHVLLDAAKQYGVEKFINISTDEVYGELADEGQFFETTPLSPNSPYSVSKASADMLGRAYHKTYGLPVITVRASNTYGFWQYPEKLIPVTIWKAVNNEKIPVYGTGRNIREWLFVSVCADSVFGILEQGDTGEIYNLGSGEEKRNIDVVKTILKLLGKPEDLIEFTKDRLGHDYRYSLNSDKLRKRIESQGAMPFYQGIEHTIQWYMDNMAWVKGKLSQLNKYWKTIYQ